MPICLKHLHKLIYYSRFVLARDQKYLCLMKAGEPGKILSSHITDELNLVAHPMGRTHMWTNLEGG